MKSRRSTVFPVFAAVAAVAVLVGVSGMAAWRIKQSMQLARQSEPFEVSPAQPVATLLVVGDSTGVGTGASAPAQSLAGLIAQAHPRVQIINRAKDGARFADIVRQLEALGDQRFDAVLVLGGGNDVIRFTDHNALELAVAHTVQLARARAHLVVIMPAGNVGNAPFFMAPLSWLMSYRSRDLHQLVRTTAAHAGALYVNLYKDKAEDPFAQQADVLNAKDGLHPSDAGYRVWLAELNMQADFARRLASLGR